MTYYQHDLNNAAGQKHRKAFISHQIDSFDEYEHHSDEDTSLDPDEDDSFPYSVFQSSFNSPEPQQPTNIFPQPIMGRNSLGCKEDDC